MYFYEKHSNDSTKKSFLSARHKILAQANGFY